MTQERIDYLKSALPYWEVTRFPNGAKVGIKCPRKDCGGKALVSSKWLEPRTHEMHDGGKLVIIGRPCTYCFKTAQIPKKKGAKK